MEHQLRMAPPGKEFTKMLGRILLLVLLNKLDSNTLLILSRQNILANVQHIAGWLPDDL